MTVTEIRPEVQNLISTRKWTALRSALVDWPAPDVADLLFDLEETERVLAFRALNREQAAEVFGHLQPDGQEELINLLKDEETRRLLAELPPDDRTHLFEELPGQVTQRLLNLLSPEDLAETRALLGYPEESVGRLMTPDYVAVRKHWTVEQALRHVRRKGQIAETINRVLIVDEEWRLVDDISLRGLILAEPDSLVEEIMDHSFASIPATADREEAVHIIQRYDQVSIPVVDSSGVLLGIVTVDDVLDVAEEEATEDIHKLGGVNALEYPYLSTSIFSLTKKRIGWLAILFAAGLGTAAAMAHFEDAIAQLPVLAVFVPLIIATGGNSGFQAASVMTRAMALREVELRHSGLVFGREVAGGLLLGGLLAILGFVMATMVGYWMYRDIPGVMPMALNVGVAVGLAVVSVVIIGNLIGSMLPFLLQRMGFDPATSSTPFVATIVDIVGLVVYFTIALWWLDMDALAQLG
ncbi:magnesium transporter [soil metagenome]